MAIHDLVAFDLEFYKRQFNEYVQEEINRMNPFNILILGKTGVGKSTLINSVFGEDLAKTGVGEPITQHLCKYTKENVPMNLFDTRGFELDSKSQSQILYEISELLNGYKSTGAEKDFIHFIWYCINAQGRRIEDFEIDLIKRLNQTFQIKTILVLTQSYGEAKKEFGAALRAMDHGAEAIVDVVSKRIVVDDSDNLFINPKGLIELLNITHKLVPEAQRTAFVQVQKVNMELKRKRGYDIVNLFIAANAGVGFIPIPFADALAMIPLELGMLAKVSTVFSSNFNEITSAVVPSLFAAGGVAAATILGKAVVSNLLKLIPGVGWVVGGIISGAAAAALTGALGYAYIEVMCKADEHMLKTGMPMMPDDFAKLLTDAIKDALTNKKSTNTSS
jgi:uncharacterized protein (DUF697 family)/GTP-binding protein EngB required for normal cell division